MIYGKFNFRFGPIARGARKIGHLFYGPPRQGGYPSPISPFLRATNFLILRSFVAIFSRPLAQRSFFFLLVLPIILAHSGARFSIVNFIGIFLSPFRMQPCLSLLVYFGVFTPIFTKMLYVCFFPSFSSGPTVLAPLIQNPRLLFFKFFNRQPFFTLCALLHNNNKRLEPDTKNQVFGGAVAGTHDSNLLGSFNGALDSWCQIKFNKGILKKPEFLCQPVRS